MGVWVSDRVSDGRWVGGHTHCALLRVDEQPVARRQLVHDGLTLVPRDEAAAVAWASVWCGRVVSEVAHGPKDGAAV